MVTVSAYVSLQSRPCRCPAQPLGSCEYFSTTGGIVELEPERSFSNVQDNAVTSRMEE